MNDVDTSELDIFEPTHNATFNACVGTNSSHDMRTYAEGYLQAAQKLLEVMFSQRMMYERDTLVHPILYSARHSIELSIKHVLIELNKIGIRTKDCEIHGHSLKIQWALFKKQTAFDRRIIDVSESIDSMVIQLDQADPDAQDFRYPVNTNGEQTLNGKFVVDLVTVKLVVDCLAEKLVYLYNLIDLIIDERNLNAFTHEFNREELKQLSLDLPDFDTWSTSDDFQTIKLIWKEKYGLSNSAFSRAVDFIKKHREFSGNINFEHDFIALDNQLLECLIKKSYEIRLEQIEDRKLDLKEQLNKPNPAYTNFPLFESRITPAVMSELNALFYLDEFSEEFDSLVKRFDREFEGLVDKELDEALKKSFIHIYEKTNFLSAVIRGLEKTGRLKLTEQLNKYLVS